MKKSQIILRFLFPPRQDAAEAVHPAMRPFHNPAASLEASFMFNRLGFLASGSNVGCITKLFHQISYLTRIISLIHRHTLWLLLCRFRTLYQNTLYRCYNHLAVMPICSSNCQAYRHTVGFRQQTSFNAFFSPIRRVWAGFFPRPVGPWPSRNPWAAKTSQYLSIHHSLPEPAPIVSEKPRLSPIAETDRVRYYWDRCRWRLVRSTGSRSAARIGLHLGIFGRLREAFRLQSGGYLLQGLLVCKACGYAYYSRPVSLNAGKGKRRAYAYYRSIASDAYRFGEQRTCQNKQVHTDLLGETGWQDVYPLLRSLSVSPRSITTMALSGKDKKSHLLNIHTSVGWS